MKRATILVMDSFGIGASADAEKFGDVGSDTFGHIASASVNKRIGSGRQGALYLPNLLSLGLAEAARISTGKYPAGMGPVQNPKGAWACAAELSNGKDTPSGHWEMAGVPVMFEWGYFRDKTESFPEELLEAFIDKAGLPGLLGNCHSSGTVILDELGEEHMRTGKPIVYTSADSVFQIACHEETFGLERLLEICQIARELLDPYNIGRVIARPFIGEGSGAFQRTGNRRDYSVVPPAPTLLDRLSESGGEVISVGKIADIFAHQGITRKVKATGIEALFDVTLKEMKQAPEQSLVFTNFVDFDSAYGHRRDIKGYAEALEDFDQRLPELMDAMEDDDLLFITADHGCDPSWEGSDHTREHVPVLVYGKRIKPGSLGHRTSFADMGQTIAQYFGLSELDSGESFLEQIV
ncbi:phosphopentomutase [Endozoicomonas gorgoniicola]|uniref:Phosphopentomutase n=1 Tax=Endozoicomonas gorgoniicola TaxID=1234144 RepID=A0ABT3MUS3_9GAMM|nr:phosphopentomutase [Endozoicomonas gorgoniicola]MCW7553136.1 phosphopentomutase [Endozoicomonas gorgoniicola]